MIENEVKEQVKVQEQTNVTSPISKAGEKKVSKKTNEFIAWLKDADTVDEKDGKVDNKTAVKSYAKGLIEIVKTVYKKPIASAVTIAAGAILTAALGYNAVVAVMGFAIVAGAAGMIYAGYSLAKPTTSNNTKQAYEVLGISTFVMGLGIYGLIS